MFYGISKSQHCWVEVQICRTLEQEWGIYSKALQWLSLSILKKRKKKVPGVLLSHLTVEYQWLCYSRCQRWAGQSIRLNGYSSNHYTRQGGLNLLMPTSATASNISGSSYLWLLLLNGQNNTQAWFMKGSACYFATGIKGTAAIK